MHESLTKLLKCLLCLSFESPKLYIAGKSHLRRPPPPTTNAGCLTKLTINSTNTQHTLTESMVFLATLSYQKVCTHILVCFHFPMRTRVRGRFCCFLFFWWPSIFIVVFLIHFVIVTDKFWNQDLTDFDLWHLLSGTNIWNNNYVIHQIYYIFLLTVYEVYSNAKPICYKWYNAYIQYMRYLFNYKDWCYIL